MKRLSLWASLFTTLWMNAPAARADSTEALLKKADSYRLAAENLLTDVLVSVTHADGSPGKERRYRVFAQAGHKSLVLMQSPAERGQKVLMLGDDFWLLMPGSARPLRITPMQKLLGDASTGDIATLSWSGDYDARLVGEERCGEAPCTHLSLSARRKALSYQRIELWLGTRHAEPIRAELYVQSDKLAKLARFGFDDAAVPQRVVAMTLVDQLSKKEQTEVRYSGQKERTVPEAWLNPMFLATNPRLDE